MTKKIAKPQNQLTELQHYSNREHEARQANWLIESSSNMTLAEKRVIYYLLRQVNPLHPGKPLEFEIKIKDFAELFGLTYINGPLYKMVRIAIENLWNRDVKIRNKEGRVTVMRYLQEHTYHDKEGYLSLKITDALASGIYSLKTHYTTILISNLSKLTSSYAFKLYELLWQHKDYGANKTQKRKKREISVADLRFYFSCEDTYPVWANFARRTIIPAIKEINENTNIVVNFEIIKKGKKVHKVLFLYGLDNDFPDGEIHFEHTEMPPRPKLRRSPRLDTSGLLPETVALLEKYKKNTNHFPYEDLSGAERNVVFARFEKFREEQLKSTIYNLRLLEAWGKQLEERGGKLPLEDAELLVEYRRKLGIFYDIVPRYEEVVKEAIEELRNGPYGYLIGKLELEPEDFITLTATEEELIEDERMKGENVDFSALRPVAEKRGRGRPKKSKVTWSFQYDPNKSDTDNIPF